MLEVKKEGILLEKTSLGFENEGVLNPGVVKDENGIHLFYRAVSKGNYSSIGYCKLKDPLHIEERFDTPVLFPQFDYELHGVEDPRIVKIDDLFYLTYTAYDGVNAMGALAISKDLKQFEKKGIIVPQITYDEFSRLAAAKGAINAKYLRYNEHEQMQQKLGKQIFVWDKNVIFFPERINGKLYFLHRIKPDIQIACVNSLDELNKEFWQNYFLHLDTAIVLSPKHKHEVSYIGGGCPPIKTIHGWLLIYHAVHDTVKGYVYSACAALLDLQDPQKEIARLPYPLFKPELEWELRGEVNNVCFPSGIVLTDDTLYIYYGAADEQIACASVNFSQLLNELLLNTKKMISEVMENRSNTISAEKDLNNIRRKMEGKSTIDGVVKLPEILFITSYPPRECGIATYSLDLIKAMNNKFNQSFTISICPIESEHEQHSYTEDVKYILNKDYPKAFITLAKFINADENIRMVMLQHEFGLFTDSEADLDHFLNILTKPVALVFHTVLPQPDQTLKEKVQHIAKACKSIIVMTNTSANILINDYAVVPEKVTVIPHGTHLVTHLDKELLKSDYKLSGKKVLSTFGLLSSGKSIETTLDALPAIVEKNPDVVFLIIGKTHPSVIKKDGERYRKMLEEKVEALKMQDYVQFINYFLPLPKLLEYLQLTDVYLFTSRDPNQAVSGTFAYAISCGCPIISTPIPHALEVLKNDAGIVVDFENSTQVSEAVIKLLGDDELRKNISSNGLHTMASTAWENAAIAHALLFEKLSKKLITLNYSIPDINLDHIKKMTTNFGMIQFSVINQPDIESGYTLDDNARAMIAMCQHFELTRNEDDIIYIRIYFKFIKHCLQSEGFFLNYVDEQETFTEQNDATNLADANGRAIWALGYLISIGDLLPAKLTVEAVALMKSALLIINKIHSTRAMAFVIKGLYYSNTKNKSENTVSLIQHLANRLVQMYRHEAENDWQWYESYLTYANSILPEALLCAWLATGEKIYKEIAKLSFDFLLTKTFTNNTIKVISNKTWLQKGQEPLQMPIGGEQPIDVAYTIMALSKFNEVFTEDKYQYKMQQSFNWFLGANHLNQIIYNPCTGGCYDGLEENYVNLNQGAESTVSYLMARLTMEKSLSNNKKICSMSINLLETVQQHLGYPVLHKIDPNTQQVTGENQTPDENKFSQAAIPAVLTAIYKYVQADEGATQLLQGDDSVNWIDKIFNDHKKEAIQIIASYAKQSGEDPVAKMNAIATETVKIVKTHLPENAGIKEVKAFFKNQKATILLYLPADLNMGELLHDNTLDDNTNKMEGPVSSLIQSIGAAFSTNATEEEIKSK